MSTYERLRWENRKLELALPEADQAIIKRLLRYLKAVPLSAADLQLHRKELIGMAQEAGARGGSFGDAVGTDEEAFCKELAAQSCKRQPLEGILYWLLITAVSLFIAYMLLWCFSGFMRYYPIRASFLVYVMLWMLFVVFTNNFLQRKQAYAKTEKRIIMGLCYALMCVPLTLFSNMLLKDSAGQPIILHLLGWVSATLLATLTLAFYLAYARYNTRRLR